MAGGPATAEPTTQDFAYTGGEQSFVVPAGVCSVTVDAFGAEGGANPSTDTLGGSIPGLGGEATATITVTPGETLTVVVGGEGVGGANGTAGRAASMAAAPAAPASTRGAAAAVRRTSGAAPPRSWSPVAAAAQGARARPARRTAGPVVARRVATVPAISTSGAKSVRPAVAGARNQPVATPV